MEEIKEGSLDKVSEQGTFRKSSDFSLEFATMKEEDPGQRKMMYFNITKGPYSKMCGSMHFNTHIELRKHCHRQDTEQFDHPTIPNRMAL